MKPMTLDRLSDAYGIAPDMATVDYANAFLRTPFGHQLPLPRLPMYRRWIHNKLPRAIPMDGVELHLPLSCAVALSDSELSAFETGGEMAATFVDTPSGSDVAIVMVVFGGAGGSTDITSPRVNATPMSLLASVRAPSDRWIDMFGLMDPPDGTVQPCANATSIIQGAVGVWTGVDSGFGTGGTATATATSVTASRTIGANDWLVMGTKNDGGAAAAGTGATQLHSSANGLGLFHSNGAPGAGSRSMQATFGGSVNWGAVIVALQAAGGGGGGGFFGRAYYDLGGVRNV